MKRSHALAAALVLLAASAAHAGAKWSSNISISKSGSTGSGMMTGAFGTIRNLNGSTNYLYCYTDTYSDGSRVGECLGYNGSQYGGCAAFDAPILDAISRLRGDDYVQISWTAGICTRIQVYVGSPYAPKQ